ncbi:MAG: restriction endonuclease subunit S [Candidatus Omnitrophica bacterium]|nr:restriction endonuclease subunit S [Candidatus Omnitrophota bacterium]
MNTSKPDEIKVSAAKSDAFGGIPEGWDIKTVKDIGRVVTGKTPPTKEGKYFGRDYPFIKIPDMGESVRIENSAMMLSHEGAQYMRSLKLPPNSVMVSCLATIGKVGITVKDSFTNQQINSIIPDSNKVVPEWIYYYFKNNTVYLESLGGGGSVYTNISKGRFENAEIVLPSIAEQRAIAKILSDLDAKIELNHQMNKTLEHIARAIFKQWFVDFKFPGYEKAKFIDDLPEGWRLGTLGEIADNPRRGINPAKIVMSTPYIGLEHMSRRCISLSEWGYADNLESNKFAFKRGEILFGKLRPYFHKVGIAPIDGVCSTDILVVASNMIS